jgi:DTW domain-containing protein YfiP
MMSAATSTTRRLTPKDAAFFLNQVEATVQRVLARYPSESDPVLKKKRKRQGRTDDAGATKDAMTSAKAELAVPRSDFSSSIPLSDRETVGIARSLSERISRANERNDCPRCWFSRAHCICAATPPASGPSALQKVDKLFLLMHQKEICLTVDTAKMILAAYPANCRLVVAGIGPEYQDTMREMESAMHADPSSFLVLFPSEDSTTVAESPDLQSKLRSEDGKVNLLVIDGTWTQARRMYQKYVAPVPGLVHIRLTDRALSQIAGNQDGSRQLRPHPEAWREIGTCAATRYLLQDLEGEVSGDDTYGDHVLAQYQARVNEAAKKLRAQTQLGMTSSAPVAS